MSSCIGFPSFAFLPMVLGARFIGGQSPGLGGRCSCVPLFSAVPQVRSLGPGQTSSGGGQDAYLPLLGPQSWFQLWGLTLARGGRVGSAPTWSCCPPPPPSQFMDSMQLDPETVDNLDAYSHIPPQLMEKCAALSVRPDTVRNLVQSMQGEQGGAASG